jgi:holliday junction DNA helicase RuvA
MIAYLKGSFEFKSPAVLHVNVNGVGYEVFVSLHTYSTLQPKNEGLVYTYLQIKEDAHALYGFATLIEKETFLHLISVSGIGANTARMMLSSLKPEEISRAIVNEDVKLLESIKGIGKKTAERCILELREKMAKSGLAENHTDMTENRGIYFANKDALNALLALGIARNSAENAVKKAAEQLNNDAKVEDLIKKALQFV